MTNRYERTHKHTRKHTHSGTRARTHRHVRARTFTTLTPHLPPNTPAITHRIMHNGVLFVPNLRNLIDAYSIILVPRPEYSEIIAWLMSWCRIIISQDIICVRETGPYIPRGKISITCPISVLRNIRKFGYIFIFPLHNLGYKELMAAIYIAKPSILYTYMCSHYV